MFKGWSRIGVITAFAFVGMFLLHWLMEWAVHAHVLGIEITEGLLSATIAGLLVFYICLAEHRRELHYRRRLEAVATLNHHVRNALQTMVAFTDSRLSNPRHELKHAIDRIDWVLRDVEPHLREPEARKKVPASVSTSTGSGESVG